MVSFAFTVFGVDWEFLKPYIVLGLALGSVYALSGVGVVVLYQATGVLNLAFGAIGAAGALIAYYLVNHTSLPHWIAYLACVVFGAAVNVVYGMVLGPAFARRDPLVKMMGTLGLALILLGVMAWRAPAGGAFVRVLQLPTSTHRFELFGAVVTLDAGHRARVRARGHGRDDALPAHDQPRHRDARARERPGDHRHAGRARAQGRDLGLARLGHRVRDRRPAARRPVHLARLHGAHVPRDLLARRGADRPAAVALVHARGWRSRSGCCRRSPRRTTRSRPTAARRRSCWRSSRCSTSGATARSRCRGRRVSAC